MNGPVVITIPGRPPNPNDYNRGGGGKQHWHAQRKEAERWRAAACLLAKEARPSGFVALGRAHMRVTFVVPRHGRRDLDNLISSTKPLTDGIVDAGILVDDSTEVIVSLSYDWRYEKGVDATIYVIEGDAATQELGLEL